ncbi:serine/threonine protein kinase [Vibrio ishigakensis]|uniref:Serine/threonine protein kinase n=1 Tax=Vibrio ishigakensis TaxID=1481914 RepID=A0A0B8Q8D9_9VIBR|nr:serine/threonine protein kinase [Vibrio ishigakensis]
MYDNPKPSLQQARSILDEIIKALRVFQRADMVHRDLKPENIMITPSGEVKIIDFGAVKVKGLEEISPESQDTVPLGAVNYIAPEYLNTGKANLVSDLFSVAVIGYEMLTGELPYKPTTNQNLNAARHTKWVCRSLSDYRDDIPTC